MNDQDQTITEADAAEAVAIALGALPQHAVKLDPGAIDAMSLAWYRLLCDLTPGQLNAALARHLAVSPWLPTVAELRAIASAAVVGRRRAGEDAWGDVRQQIGATGRYRTPRFGDPLTARCVERLGWVALCDSENATADRARFARLYDQLAAEDAEDAAVCGLPGVARPALPAARDGSLRIGAAVQRLLPSTTGEAS